jgi:hypothetical protein
MPKGMPNANANKKQETRNKKQETRYKKQGKEQVISNAEY